MNGEVGNGEKKDVVDENVELAVASEDTIVMEEISDIDNVGDISLEVNVEKLVAKLEAHDGDDADHKKEVHRRLEEVNDQRDSDQELDSTFNFNLDDDL